MSNLIVDKENFWKILDQFYAIIRDDTNNIVLNYEVLKTHPRHYQNKKYSFLKDIKKHPIKFDQDPVSFQKNLRNEWR